MSRIQWIILALVAAGTVVATLNMLRKHRPFELEIVQDAPLRYYVGSQGPDQYRVRAHEVRIEGFCTVFIRDGQRIAAICGQHTWSEAVEVE